MFVDSKVEQNLFATVDNQTIVELRFQPDTVLYVRLQRFPYPAFVDNPFILTFLRQFPVILLIRLIMSVLYITRNVVQEKEQRLKVGRVYDSCKD
jgi:hypothetical protein